MSCSDGNLIEFLRGHGSHSSAFTIPQGTNCLRNNCFQAYNDSFSGEGGEKTHLRAIIMPSGTPYTQECGFCLGEYCFADCIYLEKLVRRRDDYLTIIPDYCFYNCSSLLPMSTSTMLFFNIESIGISAFENCTATGFTEANLGAVKTISDRAFYGCTSLRVLNNLCRINGLTIGSKAFANCPIDTMYIYRSNGAVSFQSDSFDYNPNGGVIHTDYLAGLTNFTESPLFSNWTFIQDL